VFNIGDREFSAALFYVVIYSVKSLDGQLIEDTFDNDRVRGWPTGITLMRQADAQRRRQHGTYAQLARVTRSLVYTWLLMVLTIIGVVQLKFSQ
jgi:hypothetical protein